MAVICTAMTPPGCGAATQTHSGKCLGVLLVDGFAKLTKQT